MKNLLDNLKRIWRDKWLFGSVAALLSTVFAALLSLTSPFENFEYKTYDLRFSIRGTQPVEEDKIAIVGIDDQSFLALGLQWPFPRGIYNWAVQNLLEAGARLVVIDIEFAEPSDRYLKQDSLLAAAIRREPEKIILAGNLAKALSGETLVADPVPPIPAFLPEGATWGLVSVNEEADGFIRQYSLFDVDPGRGKYYYPLAVMACMKADKGRNGDRRLRFAKSGHIAIGQRTLPPGTGQFFINYRGPAGTFPTFSFSDVIDDSSRYLGRQHDTNSFYFYKDELKDKIVFIGAIAEELQDTKLTPFFKYKGVERKTPGVEVHANALSTLLRGDFITRQEGYLPLLLVLIVAVVTMVTTILLKPFKGLGVVAGLILVYFLLGIYLFNNHLLWIDLTTPMTAMAFCYVGNVLHTTLTEQRERIRIKKSWAQYMPQKVIDQMLDAGDLPKFGGERRELTILFSDIRSFTTYTEKHSSHQVVKKLREYLTEMVDVIHKHDGTLDKFVGDEVMALFGAPHYYRTHAEKACLTALEMIARLRKLQKKWASRNQDYFQIGIGINSGKVISGNLGSEQLFDYTVIGDDVNLGARLEGANKQYGTTIIISEFTHKLVKKEARVRELDLVRVKGKNKPVRIFELRGMDELSPIEQDLIIDVYSNGLNNYKDRKWYQALTEFKRVLRYFPTDGPTRVYIKRCLDFIESPPPDNWDGVYEFMTK
jgi:adenylate cyclase